TIVRFGYSIGGTATTDHIIISGLKVKYPGTVAAGVSNIHVLDASAQQQGNAESDAKNHGTLSAVAANPGGFGFSVGTVTGQPAVNPTDTRFPVTINAVQLIGNPTGGVFSGNGVSFSSSNGYYVFSPSSVGVGSGYIVTYTYTDPNPPHCTSVVSK